MKTKLDIEIQNQLDGLYVPEKLDKSWTLDRIFLNNEIVTPEMQAIFDKFLLEVAMKDAMFYRKTEEVMPDQERGLADNMELFDCIREIERQMKPLWRLWNKVDEPRARAWMDVHEETENHWVRYDSFVQKVDRKLTGIGHTICVLPTEAQWKETMAKQQAILKDTACHFQLITKEERLAEGLTYHDKCGDCTKCKRWKDHTWPLISRALALNEGCKGFWLTDEGKELNRLKENLNCVWEAVKALKAEYNVTFGDYYSFMRDDINPYFTNGETEEVDTMELMANSSYEHMDMLEDTHMEEMAAFEQPESKGRGFWSRANERKYTSVATQTVGAPQAEDVASLMAWADAEVTRGNHGGKLNLNGANAPQSLSLR